MQKKIKKYFIFSQIFIQTTLHLTALVIELNMLLGGDNHDQIKLIRSFFAIVLCVNSMIYVVTGICYSRDFMSYLTSIKRVSESFEDHKNLKNTLKKLYRVSIILIIFAAAFVTYRSTEFSKSFTHTKMEVFFLILISQTIAKVTGVFQHIMLFVFVMIVVYLFKCLISMISAVRDRVKSSDVSSAGQCDIKRELIQGWVELYRDLVNCCKKLTLCFGCQVGICI